MNKKTLLRIIKNGGATICKDGTLATFKKGFQVSKKDCYTLEVEQINNILKSVNNLLDTINSNEFCGVWVDSGLVYIDVSINIENKKTAIQKGLELQQISIFDWANKNCIYLKKQN